MTTATNWWENSTLPPIIHQTFDSGTWDGNGRAIPDGPPIDIPRNPDPKMAELQQKVLAGGMGNGWALDTKTGRIWIPMNLGGDAARREILSLDEKGKPVTGAPLILWRDAMSSGNDPGSQTSIELP